ncbi:MAG: cytochrome c biogenesis heme-transporting ATPase CcmA [Gammaproteobacteria bacterium]|nr:cytochrome c biogenesis heme-transporting ATPase CcmA [Gammaproteobacteria bacterium]
MPIADTAGRPRLEARALECIRADELVFRGVSLTVAPREVVQLVGANGSGKTSLLRILCGLTPPADGVVSWDGADIQALGKSYTAEVCYIGHLNGVAPTLTPAENLRFAARLCTAKPDLDIDAVLERMALTAIAEVPARRLSAGQRQRVALARLLVSDAPLWVLDEPLTALDTTGKALVEDLLATHAAGGGLAVVSTHQPLVLPPDVALKSMSIRD